jgi:hypothetical protein
MLLELKHVCFTERGLYFMKVKVFHYFTLLNSLDEVEGWTTGGPKR